jgi:phage gp29-like protein
MKAGFHSILNAGRNGHKPLTLAPGAEVTISARINALNAWREQYNPLRGLTISRAISLLESYQRGDMADLQWTFFFIEQTDPDLLALVERRISALCKMDWDIKIVGEDHAAFDRKLAEDQAAALRAAYERIENLDDDNGAIAHLGMATFRGCSHLEMIPDGAGDIIELRPVDQWNMVRDGLRGGWRYNPDAGQRTFSSLGPEWDIDPETWIVRERARYVDRIALIKYIRTNLSDKDWDAFIEIYGIPGWIIIMPPDIPVGQEADYQAAAENVAKGGSGALPNGSDAKCADAPRANAPFRERLDHLSEKLILAGTGGKLTMLTAATGIGQGATPAHEDAFRDLAQSEAKSISRLLCRTFDRRVLDAKFPGNPRLAYFEMAFAEETDTGAIVDHTTKLANAGYFVTRAQLAEKTGYEFGDEVAGQEDAEEAYANAVLNRAAREIGIPSGWLAPLRGIITDLEERGGGISDAEWLNALEAARDRIPEVFGAMEESEFRSALETGMGQAAIDGARQALRKHHQHRNPK